MADFSNQLYGDDPKKRDFGAEIYGDTSQQEFPPTLEIARDLAAGGLRGASSIGATIIAPFKAAFSGSGQSGALDERKKMLDEVDAGLKYFGADPESLSYQGGKIGTEITGTLGAGGAIAKGVGMVPGLSRLATAIETMGGTAGPGGSATMNALNRVAGGAISGGAQAGLVDPESAGIGAGIGAAIPVAGRILEAGTRGAGWLRDMAQGNLGKVKAGMIGRETAGGNLAAIRAANAVADPTLTAGQVAHGIDQDPYQAMARFAEKNDATTFYRPLKEGQEAARIASLDAVTPDLAAAEAARTAASKANYGAANTAQFNADPALIAIFQSPYTKQAHSAARDLIEANGLDFKTNPTGYLQAVKMGFDKMLSRSGDTALSGAEKKIVYDTRNKMLTWLESKNPAFQTARQEHARLSAPVNQSQILDEMSNVLQRGGGGERVQPFLDVMGRGESALLKRADQNPRFGGIADVLTPQQMAVRDDVANQLIRDREIKTQAEAGMNAFGNILSRDEAMPKLPGFLSVVASTANKAITALENKVNQATLDAIVEGMKSGASANQMLAFVPAHERNAVAMALAQSGYNPTIGAAAIAASRQSQ